MLRSTRVTSRMSQLAQKSALLWCTRQNRVLVGKGKSAAWSL